MSELQIPLPFLFLEGKDMENKLIQVAAATPRLKIGDVKYNTKEMIDIINESKDSGLIALWLEDLEKI